VSEMAKTKLSSIWKEVGLHLFRRPATQKYPFEKPELPDGFRGRHIFYIDRCISCSLCEKVCPSNAIEMIDVDEKKRPLFMLDRCVFCYQCAESCPKDAIEFSKDFELALGKKSELVVRPAPLSQEGDE
jgi:formate hydrogenlyase subunit 6/NADH:ubiquinone oxidoreductase subunit I